jgi:preprotein translocase SecE subunit
VSSAEAKEKKSFFTIYKPGQGKWVRWGTVAGAALLAGLGAYWLGHQQQDLSQLGLPWQIAAAAIWLVLWAWATFWFVNSPKYGEFLIMTESEMRKVTWPKRQDVTIAVKIVILLTFLLGLMLGLVDVGFIKLFHWIGVT